jgi:hypothetical protein
VKEKSFFGKFLDSTHNSILGSFFDAIGTDNGFDTWSWSCPVKTFIVDVQKSPLEDFRIYAEVYKITYNAPHIFAKPTKREFSEELLNQVMVRDFEFGKLFKQAKKSESFEDGVERYIISGDVGEEQ